MRKFYIFSEPPDSMCQLVTDAGVIIQAQPDTHPSGGESCQSCSIPDSVPNSNGASLLVSRPGFVTNKSHGLLLWGEFFPSLPKDQATMLIDVFVLVPEPKPDPPKPDPPHPQPPTDDEFPFSTASMVNSPATILSWPITAHITKVHFQADGWMVEFDRRLGSNAWPNIQSPSTGGEDTLQYTLGLCRLLNAQWVCSAVVQFWQTRLEDEGAKAGSPPNRIAQEWFYDSRWGKLEGWQPALGETVGVFIAAGDERNTTQPFPGVVPQRTAAILVKWGTDR